MAIGELHIVIIENAILVRCTINARVNQMALELTVIRGALMEEETQNVWLLMVRRFIILPLVDGFYYFQLKRILN